MSNQYRPCQECGTTKLCVRHILTSEQLDDSEESRQNSRELRELLQAGELEQLLKTL